MALQLDLSDLARLDKIQSTLAQNDTRGQFAKLGMQQVIVAEDAADALLAALEREFVRVGLKPARERKVCLVADDVAILRGGYNLKDWAFAQLAQHYTVERVTLTDGYSVLHADEEVQDRAAAACVGAEAIVSIGGGTITDVAKIAALRNATPIHIVVQTAASVDGFTDNFSVVLQKGVKRTLLTRWPDVVLTDGRTIAEAPHVLNAAGFGEMMSMFCAPGDWWLANRLGMDTTFSQTLLDLLTICGENVESWAGGVGARNVDGLSRLASGLAMRGIVTGVGGTTATLSGMEHLISHMLDIHAAETGAATGLHGAQVGVASVIASAAWEVFCERVAEAPFDVARLFPETSTYEARVKAAFGELDASGSLGASCWEIYSKKLAKWQEARPVVEAAFADWQALRAGRDGLVLNAHAIAACLHRASAPARSSELEPAVPQSLLRWSVANCQFMRERFTVADLLTFAGWWDEAGVTRVLERAELACRAAKVA